MKVIAPVLVTFLLGANARGQEWLDTVESKLSVKSRGDFFQSDLSGLLDLEGYYVDQRPPGLLFEDKSFFNPRLSLFLDTRLGTHLYSFLQARLDRGFDPGQKDFEARLDEYLLRWTPGEDSRLNLQFGKFATVVGSWVQRHDSWQNPLITAPLPYEHLTTISYEDLPANPEEFLARRRLADIKEQWLPVLWGPVYATGGSIFGTFGKFDYAFDIKNAAISSHPHSWDFSDSLWKYPTTSGRLGFRPSPAWNHGLSFSIGPYLAAETADELPVGKGIGDYNQVTLGYDAAYAWHRWQWWAEVFVSRFEVPNVGNADSVAYYIEAKYKITAGLFAAARWNQEFFGNINNGLGGEEAWDNDMLRLDLALGYRFSRHLQSKIQYSFGRRRGSLQQGEQLVAAQLTAKF
jgi:hypothetical protein